ncbi:hypothetical protein HHI36_023125, partial [Cryptolaemus montrouzieri]
ILENVLHELNAYFVSVDDCRPDDAANGDNGAKFEYESLSNSLVVENTDPQELYNIIKSLKNTRSTGFDEIPIILIKEVADQVSPVLSHLANMMIDTVRVKEGKKEASITDEKPCSSSTDKSKGWVYPEVIVISSDESSNDSFVSPPTDFKAILEMLERRRNTAEDRRILALAVGR